MPDAINIRFDLSGEGAVGAVGSLLAGFQAGVNAQGGAQAVLRSGRLFVVVGGGQVGATGSVHLAVRRSIFTLSATGKTENVGYARLVAPGFRSIYGVYRGAVDLFSLRAAGSLVEALDESEHIAYVVNVSNGAVSEYDNYPFFNVVRYRGDTLLFGSSGTFRIEGDTDGDDAINAVAELSPSDFDTSLLKRMPYAYIGLKAEEGVRVTAVADEQEIVAALTTTDGRNRRARLARGVKGRFWSLKVENIDGEFFAVDSVEYLPMLLRRKV